MSITQARSLPPPPVLAVAGAAALGATVAVGLTTGHLGYAVAGLFAGVAVTVLVLRPFWTLVLLVVVEVSNASGVLGAVGGLSPHVAVLLLATASLALGVATGRLRLHYSPVMLLAAVFVLAQAPSIITAEHPATATAVLLELAKDLWLLVVAAALALAVTNPWTIARVFTSAMAAMAGSTLVNEFLLGNATTLGGFSGSIADTGAGIVTARHVGPLADANFWGRVLLLAVPLAMSLTLEAWRRPARWAAAGWGASLLLLVGGVYLTQSRGTLLGLALVVVCWLVFVESATRWVLFYLPLVAVLLALVPGVGSRLATLGQLGGSGGAGDLSLAGRVAVQKIDLAMFADHPGLGVGLGNTGAQWNEYVAYGDTLVQRRLAPHNLYLQVAAEAGIVGLLGWVIFFVGVFLLAARVWVSHPVDVRGRAPPERLLAVALGAALVSWAFTSLFLHLSTWRYLLLVVVMVAVLDHQARPSQPRALRTALLSFLRWMARPATVACILVTVLVGTATVSAALMAQPAERVTVALQAASTPRQPGYAYNRDVVSRPIVLPTYAAVMEAAAARVERRYAPEGGTGAEYHVDVKANSTAGTVTLEAWGPDRDRARRLATEATAAAVSAVNGQPALSRFATASPRNLPTAVTRQSVRTDVLLVGIALLLVVNLAITWLARHRNRDRSPGDRASP